MSRVASQPASCSSKFACDIRKISCKTRFQTRDSLLLCAAERTRHEPRSRRVPPCKIVLAIDRCICPEPEHLETYDPPCKIVLAIDRCICPEPEHLETYDPRVVTQRVN